MKFLYKYFFILGKQNVTENHRGTTRLFTSAFSRLAEKTTRKRRDRSELI